MAKSESSREAEKPLPPPPPQPPTTITTTTTNIHVGFSRRQIIIIIIMKIFNRPCSHGHHGSKRRELAQHAHEHGSHAFTHTLYINTVRIKHVVRAPARLLRNLESNSKARSFKLCMLNDSVLLDTL